MVTVDLYTLYGAQHWNMTVSSVIFTNTCSYIVDVANAQQTTVKASSLRCNPELDK